MGIYGYVEHSVLEFTDSVNCAYNNHCTGTVMDVAKSLCAILLCLQLEDAHQKDKQEEEKADKGDDDTIKEEDNGIEMSEDFDGQLHDADDKSQEDDKDGSDDDEDSGDELDKQMGDIDGAGEQQLDERMWGSDSEDEDDDKNEVCCVSLVSYFYEYDIGVM